MALYEARVRTVRRIVRHMYLGYSTEPGRVHTLATQMLLLMIYIIEVSYLPKSNYEFALKYSIFWSIFWSLMTTRYYG
jgi:hypothetical protein